MDLVVRAYRQTAPAPLPVLNVVYDFLRPVHETSKMISPALIASMLISVVGSGLALSMKP
jgi:hypothetical protein